MTLPALVLTAISLADPAPVPAPAPEKAAAPAPTPPTLTGRRVHWFEGGDFCPLAGAGTRSATACSRIAFDDATSSAEIDRAHHRIALRNVAQFDHKTLIGDVLLQGTTTLASGERLPIAVHLMVSKRGKSFDTRIHSHAVSREKGKSYQLEPWTVSLSNGEKETVVLTPEKALEAVRDPGLAAKLAEQLVEVRDDLPEVKPDPKAPLRYVAAVSVGVGLGAAAKYVARADLLVAREGAPKTVAELLRSGTWELRISCLSHLLPKDVFRRDLFLYGLEGNPVLAKAEKDGLEKGQTLTLAMHAGKGTLVLGDAAAELPDAVDSARGFLEMSFLGSIIARQAQLQLGK